MVGGGVWRYILVGWVWVDIFYGLARMVGGIFWVIGARWRYILCEWTIFIGGWEWVEVYLGRWIFFMGGCRFLVVGGGWERVGMGVGIFWVDGVWG